jgi:integrase
MAKRRGNGEGSVYRKKDGTWCAVLTVGYDENGRRKRRYLYGPTKAEVLEKLDGIRSDVRIGNLTEPSRLRLSEFVQNWMEVSAKSRLRPTTLSTYQSLLKSHILPHLGGSWLDKLTPLQLQAWETKLREAGVSPRQRQAAHVLLKTILGHAFKLGLIPRNPLEVIDKPRIPKRELQVLSPDEVRQLLQAVQGHRLEPLIILAVATGARQGELFGLQWRDVDLEKGVLTIQRSLIETRGHLEFGEPKTNQSQRRVDLPDYAVRALRAHREREPAIPHPAMLIFSDTEGKPLRKSNFTRRVWHPLLSKAGLPGVRFHTLRHSHITSLLAAGGNLKAVSERVGHSRTPMTADVYAHAVEGMQRELAQKLEQIYG